MFAAGFCLLAASALYAQTSLDNSAIVKMVKAGLGDGVILSMVQNQPGNYSVTPDTMVQLKQAGVPDDVLAAMASKNSNAAPLNNNAAPPAEQSAAIGGDPYDAMDIGVYRQVQGQWVEVPTETVNWKSGGFLKSIATDGIVKGDINGHLDGGASRTTVNTPMQFLIIAPDGNEATNFELVRMHAKGNQREFRTVTGGVFHASGGTSRDAVSFDEKRVERHVYTVDLPNDLAKGEYAFLALGFSGSTAGGSVGKAFTFRVGE